MSYYTNLTKNDLLISDIGITIKVGQTVSPRQINPLISNEQLHESESIGGLYKAQIAKKIAKSYLPPRNNESISKRTLREAEKPIPSRSRKGIALDPKRKEYIEELTGVLDEHALSKFTEYADGFAEPDIEIDEGGVLEAEEKIETADPSSRYIDI
jgi:hypothetical protein